MLNSDIDERTVCTVQPLGVAENASFVVDIDIVHFHDLKADDLGVWSPTGTKKCYFRFTPSGTLKISQRLPSGGLSGYYTLTRRYYVHKTYDKFHRQLVDIKGCGEMHARGLNKLPRNVQQMKNYRRSEVKKDGDVLYSVMLQCKMSQGKSSSFVRDVKAAPDPQCVLFTEWQVSDLVRFVTKSTQFTVLVADTTYNLGDFYVTPTTYQHLMLEDSVTKKHPSFLGPVLVHQRKNFSSFNYFASTLIGANTKLRSVQAFGTDGDPALIEALSHNFHSAKQLHPFEEEYCRKTQGSGNFK